MSDHENARSDDVQRWTGKRKADLVPRILGGKISVAEAGRKHSLTRSEVEEWMEEASVSNERRISTGVTQKNMRTDGGRFSMTTSTVPSAAW